MSSVGMYSYLPCSGAFASPFGYYFLGMNNGYMWRRAGVCYAPPIGVFAPVREVQAVVGRWPVQRLLTFQLLQALGLVRQARETRRRSGFRSMWARHSETGRQPFFITAMRRDLADTAKYRGCRRQLPGSNIARQFCRGCSRNGWAVCRQSRDDWRITRWFRRSEPVDGPGMPEFGKLESWGWVKPDLLVGRVPMAEVTAAGSHQDVRTQWRRGLWRMWGRCRSFRQPGQIALAPPDHESWPTAHGFGHFQEACSCCKTDIP